MTLRFQLSTAAATEGRLAFIDELKGFALLLVVLYHAGGVLDWPNTLHGETGVDIFLIISGFALTRSATEMPAGQFLRRRLLRIFPAYWATLALFLWLQSACFRATASAGNIVAHVFALHAFDLVHKDYFSAINDSFWFISLILLLYLVFLAIRSRLDDLCFVAGIGLVLTAACSALYLHADHAGGVIQFAVRIPSFFLGLIVGQLSRPRPAKLTLSPWLVAGALTVTYVGFWRAVVPFYPVAAAALILAFIVLRRTCQRHPDGRVALRALGWLGVYSYEIFLLHQPLIRDYNRLVLSRVLGAAGLSPGRVLGGMLVAFAATCLAAYGLHRAIAFVFASRPRAVRSAVAHAQ